MKAALVPSQASGRAGRRPAGQNVGGLGLVAEQCRSGRRCGHRRQASRLISCRSRMRRPAAKESSAASRGGLDDQTAPPPPNADPSTGDRPTAQHRRTARPRKRGMIRATIGWRTTSLGGEVGEADALHPRRTRSASIRPDITPRGRSIWVTSPVTAIRLPSPRRVRNIFICIVVAFCASSSTRGVGQRPPAHEGDGAISICFSSISFWTCFGGRSRSARRRAAA